MASLVKTQGGTEGAPGKASAAVSSAPSAALRLETAHRTLLAEAEPRVHLFLRTAHRWALVSFEGAGKTDAADRLAASAYVASVVVALAAEGELDAADAKVAVETLAEVRSDPRPGLRDRSAGERDRDQLPGAARVLHVDISPGWRHQHLCARLPHAARVTGRGAARHPGDRDPLGHRAA